MLASIWLGGREGRLPRAPRLVLGAVVALLMLPALASLRVADGDAGGSLPGPGGGPGHSAGHTAASSYAVRDGIGTERDRGGGTLDDLVRLPAADFHPRPERIPP